MWHLGEERRGEEKRGEERRGENTQCIYPLYISLALQRGTNRGAILIIVCVPGPLDRWTVTHVRGDEVAKQRRLDVKALWNWTFCEYNFLLACFFLGGAKAHCYSSSWRDVVPSPCSEGTNRDAISIFLCVPGPMDLPPPPPRMRALTTLPSNVVSDVPLWMEWTRKHQNLTSARVNFVFRSSMPVRQKSNASKGVKRENLFSRLTEETSQPESTEATQSLTAARYQQTSVSNSRTKARARTLPWKWNNNQRQVLTQPTTSSMQTMWAKTSTAWTWDPCSQTVDLMWGHFPSC